MSQTRSKFWLIAAPFAWLTAFFLVPFGIVAKISLSDAAIARPPYIPTLDIAGLAVDVRDFDPTLALNGGIDGMACWQGLIPRLGESLRDKGAAFVEIGLGQEAAIVQLAANANLEFVKSYRDLSNITRCLQFGIKM